MKLDRLLASPPPSTVWVLDDDAVTVARWDRKGSMQLAAARMPSGAVEIGPVGLQAVDVEALSAVLGALNRRVDGSRRPAVAVATRWCRSHLLEMERIPSRRTELEEVVRWRLKKLLPALPSELRLATAPQAPDDGRRQLLCVAGFERGFAGLENAFGSVDLEPGLLTPQLLAVGETLGGTGARLLVQQEPGLFSLLLMQRSAVRLVRTKPLSAAGGVEAAVEQEIRLGVGFIRERLQVEGDLQVTILCQDGDLADGVRAWWSEQEAVIVEEPTDLSRWPAGEDRRLAGDARLEVAQRVLDGGEQ